MTSSSTPNTATLRLSRETGQGEWRSYKVMVDGSVVSRIKQGQTIEVSVSPGRHHLRLKVDWAGSPELAVETGAGQRADFVCQSAAATPGIEFYNSFFRRSRFLDLRPLGEPFPPAGDRGADIGIRTAIIVPSVLVFAGLSVFGLPELGLPDGWPTGLVYDIGSAAIMAIGLTVPLPPVARAKQNPPDW
jgi:hypothetical protein